MMPRILVLEGPDGCGKSSHADRLAAVLRAEGHNARAFHHTKPADADPVLAALDYARQRRVLCLHAEPGEVIVVDRWWHSSEMMGEPLNRLASTEANIAGFVPPLACLIAPDRVLDARLAARGAPATAQEKALRRTYSTEAKWRPWRVVDTSRPADDVAAELLAWARGVLR